MGVPSIITAFIQTLRLIDIRMKAEPLLCTIAHGGADLVNKNLGAIVEVNTALDEFIEQIPHFLCKPDLPDGGSQSVADSPRTKCFQLQSDALKSAWVLAAGHCVLLF